jgi:hypothetical protein
VAKEPPAGDDSAYFAGHSLRIVAEGDALDEWNEEIFETRARKIRSRFIFLLDFFLYSTYTTMQLQHFALQLHSKIVQRENSHGNEESSEEGR